MLQIYTNKKYGSNFKEFILNEKAYNTYRYLYVAKGITKEDISVFIGFFGLHSLQRSIALAFSALCVNRP